MNKQVNELTSEPMSVTLCSYDYFLITKTPCLLGTCSITAGSDTCRPGYNHSRDPAAQSVHEPLLELPRTDVVGHLEVPDS